MKWKDRCIQEANCGHNDGWTTEWYNNELKKIEKKEKNLKKRKSIKHKPFWQIQELYNGKENR